MHQVSEKRLHAVLAEHRGNLSAVIRPVIGEMLQRLPERIFVRAEVDRLVFENAVELRLG